MRAGPLNVAGSYGRTRIPGQDDFRVWNVGASFALPIVKVSALYHRAEFQPNGLANVQQKLWAVGLNVPIGQAELRATYQRSDLGGGAAGSGLTQCRRRTPVRCRRDLQPVEAHRRVRRRRSPAEPWPVAADDPGRHDQRQQLRYGCRSQLDRPGGWCSPQLLIVGLLRQADRRMRKAAFGRPFSWLRRVCGCRFRLKNDCDRPTRLPRLPSASHPTPLGPATAAPTAYDAGRRLDAFGRSPPVRREERLRRRLRRYPQGCHRSARDCMSATSRCHSCSR